jgi:hypothetical protein
MANNRLVWFLLVDGEGQAFRGTTTSKVRIPSNGDVDDFRDAVKEKYADSHLKGIAPSDLVVYEARNALEEDEQIGDRGARKANALVVVVPDKKDQDLPQTKFWVVDGSVENALTTRGVRGRLYRLADVNLGYYDPNTISSDNKIQAFWYIGARLMFHVIFEQSEFFILVSLVVLLSSNLTIHLQKSMHCTSKVK